MRNNVVTVKIDELDKKVMYNLHLDSSTSIPILSKKLGVNSSMLYSRIKRLLKNGVIKKYTIQVDDSKLGVYVCAQIGINRSPKLKRYIHEQLLQFPSIVSIAEVSGRFDLMVTVRVKSIELLHSTIIDKIGKMEGVQNTETFVELERIEKDLEYLKPV